MILSQKVAEKTKTKTVGYNLFPINQSIYIIKYWRR
jgi:hypothetical protein